MSNIRTKLQYLDFPECTKEALNYLVHNFASDSHRGVPGRAGSNENFALTVAQEYIVDVAKKKGLTSRVSTYCSDFVDQNFLLLMYLLIICKCIQRKGHL